MNARRELLSRCAALCSLLLGAGLPRAALAQTAGYNAAAFEARTVAELMKALGAPTPVPSNEISIQGPELAEDGAFVLLGASTTLPGVRRLLLLVEKNPVLLSAMFEFGDAAEPAFATRVKMAQSSNVIAVALLADGRVLSAQKNVEVTIGGCGA